MHGIDIESFRPLSSEEKEQLREEYSFTKRHILLHPARILRWKGIVPAITALPEVIKSFPDTLLVLTGRIKPIFKEEEEEEEIKNYNLLVDQTVKDLKLGNNVHQIKCQKEKDDLIGIITGQIFGPFNKKNQKQNKETKTQYFTQ